MNVSTAYEETCSKNIWTIILHPTVFYFTVIFISLRTTQTFVYFMFLCSSKATPLLLTWLHPSTTRALTALLLPAWRWLRKRPFSQHACSVCEETLLPWFPTVDKVVLSHESWGKGKCFLRKLFTSNSIMNLLFFFLYSTRRKNLMYIFFMKMMTHSPNNLWTNCSNGYKYFVNQRPKAYCQK